MSTDSTHQIKLLKVTKSDLELLLAWRSNSEIYRHFFEQKQPPEWNEHLHFWENRKDRVDWMILFSENGAWRKVGTANAKNLSQPSPEIGILIGEVTLQGRGVGTKVIQKIIAWLIRNGYKETQARILKQNLISRKIFEKNLFANSGLIPKTQLLKYTRKLHD